MGRSLSSGNYYQVMTRIALWETTESNLGKNNSDFQVTLRSQVFHLR